MYVFKYYLFGILLSGVILLPMLGGFFHSARLETGIFDGIPLFWTTEEILLKLQNLFIHKRSAMFAVSLGISFISFLAVIRCWLGRGQRERIYSALLTIAYVSPFVWSMMNGFSYPDHRWVYVVYFGIAYGTILLIEHCEEGIGRKRMVVAAAFFICAMCYHFWVERDKIRTAVFLVLAAAYIWCFFADREKRSKNLMILLFGNILLNLLFLEGPYQICGQELCKSFMPRDEMKAVARTVEEMDFADEWYRIDKQEIANQGALLQGYRGCWAYYSIINANIWSFYDALKLSPAMQSINRIYGLDGREVTESLLSVKYYQEDGIMKENMEYLPQGVEYTLALEEAEFWRLSPLERQEAMTKGVVLENPRTSVISAEAAIEEDTVTALECEIEYKNIIRKNDLLMAGEDAEIIIHRKDDLTAFDLGQGELYLYLEGVEVGPMEEGGAIQAAGKTLSIHNAADVYTTGQLDQLVKLETVGQDIILELAEDTAYHIGGISVYWYDLEAAREALAALRKHALTNLVCADNCLEGDIDAAGGYLFLSIPYDRAWKVHVDQVEVPVERANVGFMAVKLPEGKHHVRVVYEPILQKAGLLATIIGILLIAGEGLRQKFASQTAATLRNNRPL